MVRRVLALFALGLAALMFLSIAVIATSNAQASVAGPPSEAALEDIPPQFLALYQEAAALRCPTLPWSVLAAIGKVESDHGRLGGSTLDANGLVSPPIVGMALDGSPGVQLIRDTDGGRLDGDRIYDRAVGPMQILPSTWAEHAVDADGDGTADPQSAHDAVHTSAVILCASGGGDPARLRQAIWSYNHSWSYVDEALSYATEYATLPSGGPADPVLIASVLDNPRIEIYAAGRDDIAAGRIDNRVLALLQTASQRWTLSVSSLQTGHSKCVGGGSYDGCSVSNHWYGRAVDVYRVNGSLVTASNADAYEMAVWLAGLDDDSRPNEVGSPWRTFSGIAGFFHDAAHRDHLHIGWD